MSVKERVGGWDTLYGKDLNEEGKRVCLRERLSLVSSVPRENPNFHMMKTLFSLFNTLLTTVDLKHI